MAESIDALAFLSEPYFTSKVEVEVEVEDASSVAITSTEIYVLFSSPSSSCDHNVQDLVTAYMKSEVSSMSSSSSSHGLQGLLEYLTQKKAEIVTISCGGFEVPSNKLLGAIDSDNRVVFISCNVIVSGGEGSVGSSSSSSSSNRSGESSDRGRSGDKKTLFSVSHYPSSDGLRALKLSPGKNVITVQSATTKLLTSLDMFAYGVSEHFIVMDIDGTVTRSDVRGYLESFLFKKYSYTHPGLAEFLNLATDTFQCRVVYLTSRPISHRNQTRGLIYGVKSVVPDAASGGGIASELGTNNNGDGSGNNTGKSSIFLPAGPLFMNRQHTIKAAYSELISRASESFKIGVLQDIVRTYCIARSLMVQEEGKQRTEFREAMDPEYLKTRQSKYYSSLDEAFQVINCLGVISAPDCLGISNIVYADSSNKSQKADMILAIDSDESTKSETIERDQLRVASATAPIVEVPKHFTDEIQILTDNWFEDMCLYIPESINYTRFKSIDGLFSDTNVNLDYLLSLGIPKPICLRMTQANCLFLIRMNPTDFMRLSIDDLYANFSVKSAQQLDIVEVGSVYFAASKLLSTTNDGVDRSVWFKQIEYYLYNMYKSFKARSLDANLRRAHVYKNSDTAGGGGGSGVSKSSPIISNKVTAKAAPLEKQKSIEKIPNLADDMYDLVSPFCLGVGNKDSDARAYFKTNIQSILIINPSSMLKTFDPPPELNNSLTQASWNKFKTRVGRNSDFQGYNDNRLVDFLDRAVSEYRQDISYAQHRKGGQEDAIHKGGVGVGGGK